jgi:hypothetical protein
MSSLHTSRTSTVPAQLLLTCALAVALLGGCDTGVQIEVDDQAPILVDDADPVVVPPAEEPVETPAAGTLPMFDATTCFQDDRGLAEGISLDEVAHTNAEYCTTVCHSSDVLIDAFNAQRHNIARVDHETFVDTAAGCRAVEATHATIDLQWQLSPTGMFPEPGWLASWDPEHWSTYEEYTAPEGVSEGPLVVHGVDDLVLDSDCNETVYLLANGTAGAHILDVVFAERGGFAAMRPDGPWGHPLCGAVELAYLATRIPPSALDHAPTIETSCWVTGDVNGPQDEIQIAVQITMNYTRLPGGKVMLIDESVRIAHEMGVDVSESEIAARADAACADSPQE